MSARAYFNEDSGLPMIEQDGVMRVLACLPPREVCALPEWTSANPVLPPHQWQETDAAAAYPDTPIRDQGSSSACSGFAGAEGISHARLRDGQPYAHLHCGFLYSLVNGDRDRGAVLSDVLEAAKRVGCCRMDRGPANAIYRRQFGSAAFEDAANFRLREAFELYDVDEIWSALSLGKVVVAGILVGRNFGDLDSCGVAPLPDSVLGGHALCLTGLTSRGRYGLCAHAKNSWASNWGEKGWCYLRREHFRQTLGAFAIEPGGVIDDPTDENAPIPAWS